MTVPTIDQWLAAAFLYLGAHAYWMREVELIMPEVRQLPWTALLRRIRDIRERWGNRAEIWPGDNDDPDGENYVRILNAEDPEPGHAGLYRFPVVSRPGAFTVELPCTTPVPRKRLADGQRPPWADAPKPSPLAALVSQTGPHPWTPGDLRDPPTLVRGMRVIMDEDPDGVGHYVDRLPRYED